MAKKESYRITLIPGDGIGPEVTSAARKVIAAAGVVVDWEIVEAGAGAIDKHQTTLPEETLESIKANKVALKGPLTTPVGEGFQSVNVGLRKSLNLYANIRPVRSAMGISFQHLDISFSKVSIFHEPIKPF